MLWRQDVREELEGFRFEAQSVGVYDTVYLTASSSRQSLVASLVAALLSQLRDACFNQHRIDRAKGKRRPATLWALDEVAGSRTSHSPGPNGARPGRVPRVVRQHRGLPTAAGQ